MKKMQRELCNVMEDVVTAKAMTYKDIEGLHSIINTSVPPHSLPNLIGR